MRDQEMTTSEIATELAFELEMDVDALKKEVEKIMSRGAERGTRREIEPITKDQYAGLRSAMHDRDFQSGQYASENRVPLAEVNAAVRSRSYDDYLATR